TAVRGRAAPTRTPAAATASQAGFNVTSPVRRGPGACDATSECVPTSTSECVRDYVLRAHANAIFGITHAAHHVAFFGRVVLAVHLDFDHAQQGFVEGGDKVTRNGRYLVREADARVVGEEQVPTAG